MKTRKLLYLFLICLSFPVYCLDIACHEESDVTVSLDQLNFALDSVPIGEGKNLVTIRLPSKFKGKSLYDVSLTVGEWRYNKKGVLEESPEVSASLKINRNKKMFVTFILGEKKSPITISVLYGENCGHKFEIDDKILFQVPRPTGRNSSD